MSEVAQTSPAAYPAWIEAFAERVADAYEFFPYGVDYFYGLNSYYTDDGILIATWPGAGVWLDGPRIGELVEDAGKVNIAHIASLLRKRPKEAFWISFDDPQTDEFNCNYVEIAGTYKERHVIVRVYACAPEVVEPTVGLYGDFDYRYLTPEERLRWQVDRRERAGLPRAPAAKLFCGSRRIRIDRKQKETRNGQDVPGPVAQNDQGVAGE